MCYEVSLFFYETSFSLLECLTESLKTLKFDSKINSSQ